MTEKKEKIIKIDYEKWEEESPGFVVIASRCKPLHEDDKRNHLGVHTPLPELTKENLPVIEKRIYDLAKTIYRKYLYEADKEGWKNALDANIRKQEDKKDE